MIDQRTRNEYPKAKSVTDYLQSYAKKLGEVLSQVDPQSVEAVYELFKKTWEKRGTVYVAGNGGSSAIASHLCCDWMKGTQSATGDTVKVHSLMDNTALLTALCNDVSYEEGVAAQVRMMGEAGDVIVLISSSGNSPNMLAAAKAAREKKMKVVSFVGFSGGQLKDAADVSLYVPIDNYGVVEDSHQVLMHVMAQFLYLEKIQRPRESAKKDRTPELNP